MCLCICDCGCVCVDVDVDVCVPDGVEGEVRASARGGAVNHAWNWSSWEEERSLFGAYRYVV